MINNARSNNTINIKHSNNTNRLTVVTISNHTHFHNHHKLALNTPKAGADNEFGMILILIIYNDI